MKKLLGITLLEMLISLFLVCFISTMLIQVYLQTKKQFLKVEQILGQKLELQWIHSLLAQSIRQAGFTPCVSLNHLHAMDRRYNNSISPWVIGQNSVQLNYMQSNFTELKIINHAFQLEVTNAQKIHKNRPLIIADCEQAEVVNISNIDYKNNRITLASPLQFTYTGLTYVGEWIEEIWSIEQNVQKNKALFYQVGHKEELSSMVENLHAYLGQAEHLSWIEITLSLKKEQLHRFKIGLRNS